RVGCNFIPSTAINQLEMWQAESFDPETNGRELEWAASLGFNIVRVYLHDLLWKQDAPGFLERIDRFLELAHSHGIAVMFVLFDDVWCAESRLGPQPEPYPGRHNSGWVQGPGLSALEAYPNDGALRERLEDYVRGVVGALARDERVIVWDVYNEPGGYPSPGSEPVGEACLPLLSDVFEWVRDCVPTQPVTCGLWENPMHPLPPAIGELQLAASDIVSFHHYGPIEALREMCERLTSKTDRPLFCTEYLARPMHSRFESHLPFFREMRIGAINWGLVNGKTQTIYPWWSWFDEQPAPEPEVWFHDIFRADGTPFDPEEAAFLRQLLT
ncbi:MAG: cellulase family glycosylhydrolase, partial [Myxococcota bacterium]